MSRLIIIAGPQAAGKSTFINRLSADPRPVTDMLPRQKRIIFFPLQESRQIIVHQDMVLGAIFMAPAREQRVIDCDLQRMDTIRKRDGKPLIFLDECNIFTIAHALAHGATNVQENWDGYIERLKKLDAAVIFIDIPPYLSWERRKKRYEQRLVYFDSCEHSQIMRRYRDYLDKLEPLLVSVFNRLPFPKVMVNGCDTEDNVFQAVCKRMVCLLG